MTIIMVKHGACYCCSSHTVMWSSRVCVVRLTCFPHVSDLTHVQIVMLQDVGFDYQWKVGKDNQVIDVYFHHHFPKAVRPLASRLQRCIQQDY